MASKRRTPATAPNRTPGVVTHLRVVPTAQDSAPAGDTDAPAPPPLDAPPSPSQLAAAVAGGDYLQILTAQRSELAQLAERATGQVKVTALRQLMVVSEKIEALTAAAGG